MTKTARKTAGKGEIRSELFHALVEKERLTEAEAEKLISMIDKKVFFEQLIHILKYKYLLGEEEIVSILESSTSRTSMEGEELPAAIFNSPVLSALEAICKYLKEEQGMRYAEIASLLNRDQRTIWVTYSNACKKMKEPLHIKCDKGESDFTIPLAALQDRKLSVLESIVCHLRKSYSLRYVEIAKLIGRDERNIGAIYHKAENKVKNG
jgi:DNA-binding CsgD family transcriptional regulator